jgi:hypothetical protein
MQTDVAKLIGEFPHIVSCRPVYRQRPPSKQLYNSRCYVTAPPTDMNATIVVQQKNGVFCAVNVEML